MKISFPFLFYYNTSCYSTFKMSSKKKKKSTQLILFPCFLFIYLFLSQTNFYTRSMGIATKVVAETWQWERDGLQLALSLVTDMLEIGLYIETIMHFLKNPNLAKDLLSLIPSDYRWLITQFCRCDYVSRVVKLGCYQSEYFVINRVHP